MASSPYDYAAFISYSHKNKRYAKWLQRHLERYRFPAALMKDYPTLPRGIKPVFLDDTDLVAPSSLVNALQNNVESAGRLIVLCSPFSAASPYVNDEIECFLKSGRADHIIPIIMDGEPKSQDPARECFPPALRSLGRKDELLGISYQKYGKRGTFLRVIATILHMRLDSLIERDAAARRKRLFLLAGVSLAVCLIIISLLFRSLVESQRREAEALLVSSAEEYDGGDRMRALRDVEDALSLSWSDSGIEGASASALLKYLHYYEDWAPLLDLSIERGAAIVDIAATEDGSRAVLLDNYGYVSCYDTLTGRKLWETKRYSNDGSVSILPSRQAVFYSDERYGNNILFSLADGTVMGEMNLKPLTSGMDYGIASSENMAAAIRQDTLEMGVRKVSFDFYSLDGFSLVSATEELREEPGFLSVQAACFSPDEAYFAVDCLVSSGGDYVHKLWIFDTASGRQLFSLSLEKELDSLYTGLCFLPDGSLMHICEESGTDYEGNGSGYFDGKGVYQVSYDMVTKMRHHLRRIDPASEKEAYHRIFTNTYRQTPGARAPLLLPGEDMLFSAWGNTVSYYDTENGKYLGSSAFDSDCVSLYQNADAPGGFTVITSEGEIRTSVFRTEDDAGGVLSGEHTVLGRLFTSGDIMPVRFALGSGDNGCFLAAPAEDETKLLVFRYPFFEPEELSVYEADAIRISPSQQRMAFSHELCTEDGETEWAFEVFDAGAGTYWVIGFGSEDAPDEPGEFLGFSADEKRLIFTKGTADLETGSFRPYPLPDGQQSKYYVSGPVPCIQPEGKELYPVLFADDDNDGFGEIYYSTDGERYVQALCPYEGSTANECFLPGCNGYFCMPMTKTHLAQRKAIQRFSSINPWARTGNGSKLTYACYDMARNTWTAFETPSGNGSAVFALANSEPWLAALDENGILYLADVREEKTLRSFSLDELDIPAYPDAVSRLQFLPGDEVLALIQNDLQIHFINTKDGMPLCSVRLPDSDSAQDYADAMTMQIDAPANRLYIGFCERMPWTYIGGSRSLATGTCIDLGSWQELVQIRGLIGCMAGQEVVKWDEKKSGYVGHYSSSLSELRDEAGVVLRNASVSG